MRATFISRKDPNHNFGQTLEYIEHEYITDKGEDILDDVPTGKYIVKFDDKKNTVTVYPWQIIFEEDFYKYPKYHKIMEKAEKEDSKL
jgi:hypothetical protein